MRTHRHMSSWHACWVVYTRDKFTIRFHPFSYLPGDDPVLVAIDALQSAHATLPKGRKIRGLGRSDLAQQVASPMHHMRPILAPT